MAFHIKSGTGVISLKYNKKGTDGKMAAHLIYQLYSELADFEPKIWRRFQVAGNITLARLGYIVMTLYEMKACHLFSVDFPIDKNLQFDLTDIPNFHPVSPEQERVEHYEVPSEEVLPDTPQHRNPRCHKNEAEPAVPRPRPAPACHL